jgi:hypothetical protein
VPPLCLPAACGSPSTLDLIDLYLIPYGARQLCQHPKNVYFNYYLNNNYKIIKMRGGREGGEEESYTMD